MTATTGTATKDRTYRFAPIDRTGWILGLGGAQCVIVAAGVLLAGAFLRAGAPAPFVLGPVAAAAVLGFGSWEGRTAHEWTPILARHLALRVSGSHRWFAPLPYITGTASDRQRPPALPPFLAGVDLLDAGAALWCGAAGHAGIGVLRDGRDRSLSASLTVRGRAFSLVERSEQERIVERWGDALSAFCTERRGVTRVRVTERCSPAGIAENERFAQAHGTAAATSEARRSYVELLAEAGPLALRHEAVVTVSVAARKGRGGRRAGHPEDGAIETLIEELRLLTARLEAAGVEVDPPLSVAQTAEMLRLRLDPASAPAMAARASTLAELAGVVSPASMGPMATATEWGHVVVDGSCHRTYWVAEWPRLDVGPNWLEPMLLHAGGVRTFALHYEPVPPSRSQRRIERDSTRLATDEEQRSRAGFRIGARHHRAQAAVAEREAELVAGYAELEYAGFLTVSAPDPDLLALSCSEHEQIAAQAGLELRALDGRHDLGLVCSLPVGRGIAPRRFA